MAQSAPLTKEAFIKEPRRLYDTESVQAVLAYGKEHLPSFRAELTLDEREFVCGDILEASLMQASLDSAKPEDFADYDPAPA